MTKRQLIDQILDVNSTADPGFLAQFDPGELGAYLRHLRQARLPRLAGDPHRFDHYFENCPTVRWRPAARPAQTSVAVAEPEPEPAKPRRPAAPAADDTAEDQGLYVPEDVPVLYDAPVVRPSTGRIDTSAAAAQADRNALDLAYVPADRPAEGDSAADNQQQDDDSSFAEVEEDTEAWLF